MGELGFVMCQRIMARRDRYFQNRACSSPAMCPRRLIPSWRVICSIRAEWSAMAICGMAGQRALSRASKEYCRDRPTAPEPRSHFWLFVHP